jgi:hypothetical protein
MNLELPLDHKPKTPLTHSLSQPPQNDTTNAGTLNLQSLMSQDDEGKHKEEDRRETDLEKCFRISKAMTVMNV